MSTAAAGIAYDLISMGRIGVDIYPEQIGLPLESVETFSKSVGGSATNVAIAAARHGHRAAVVTRTGDDPFGRYVVAELERLGVATCFIDTVPGLTTPVTFCEIFPPDDFPLYFYRAPTAPDLLLTADSLDLEAIRAASVFWTTLTGLSEEPSRQAHHAAYEARGRRPFTVLDLDYRPTFWSSAADARREAERALERVTVAIGNSEECRVAVGETDPERAADALLDRGVELAVVKLGADGVVAKTADSSIRVAAHRVAVVNGLGSGDGFGGALCHGLIRGWPLDRLLRFANAAGALVATRMECSTAMPTSAEVEAMVAGGSHA